MCLVMTRLAKPYVGIWRRAPLVASRRRTNLTLTGRAHNMGVNALVVSQDVSANNLIASLLLEFRIETQAITDISRAQALLRRARFAALIVDYDLPGAELLLGDFASSRSGKSVISFALLSLGDRKGSRVANFVFSKPLQEKAIRSTL